MFWKSKDGHKKQLLETIKSNADGLDKLFLSIDLKILSDKYPQRIGIYENINSQKTQIFKELVNLTNRSVDELKAYIITQSALSDMIRESGFIYRSESSNWILECPYRTIKNFEQTDFGPLDGTHLLYPSERGLGGRKGYFKFKEGADDESYYVTFNRMDGKEGKVTTLFSYQPYQFIVKGLILSMQRQCKDNGLPKIDTEIMQLIPFVIGSYLTIGDYLHPLFTVPPTLK